MKIIIAAALVVVGALCADAQTPRFRSSVSIVRVDALVTDGRHLVSGLSAANFDVRDNGVPQKILDVQFETLPLNVICVLDVSGSVAGNPLVRLKDATGAVVDSLAAGDRAALVTFSNRLRLHSRFTSDRAALRAAIDSVEAGGPTAVFDAIFAGLALREAVEGRALLLVFSDGEDTASWLTASQIIESAKRSDIVIYLVKPRDVTSVRMLSVLPGPQGQLIRKTRRETPPAEHVFGELADVSGGRVVISDAGRPLRETFLATLSEFRQRYVISYEPTGVPAGGWHSVEVKLRGRSGQVKARRGYADSR